MWAAIKSGMGKVPGGKVIALGTKPTDIDHFFNRGLREFDYAQLHQAREGDPPYRKSTIRRANPSYDQLPSLRAEIADDMRAAKRDSNAKATFLAYRLNRGVSDISESVIVDLGVWAAGRVL